MEKINNVTAKKKTAKFDGIFKKLKSIKNIELIIAAVFIGIILIIFFSGSLFGGKKDDTVTFTLNEYGVALEKKLEKILGDISGAGKVSVMITFESGVEIITASTISKQSNTVIDDYSGGYRETKSVTENDNPLIINGKAVVLKEIEPTVKGVVIVSEGAGSVRVKIELTKAVSTLLSLQPEKIEIFEMTR
ncbi:MAG: hypothetical protein PHE12_00835 [Clostridia bacterium]|nr:hypothetical protein [Clostridia bacterium]